MSLGIRIFLWATIVWLAPFLRWQMRNEAKFKKNICIGATLPSEAKNDEQVIFVIEKYKKAQNLVCFVLLATAIGSCFFLKDFKWMMNSYCFWCDLCVVLPYIPFVRANRKLSKIKEDRGWNKEANADTVYIDMSAIPEQKWISPWVFAVLTVICLLPIIWCRQAWILCISFAATNIVAWICYRYCLRTKADIVDENSELTSALTRIRRYNWSKLWIIMAVSTAILSVAASFVVFNGTALIILLTVWSFIVIYEILKIEVKVRKLLAELTQNCGEQIYIDDDRYWIGGVLYCNPNDSHTMVNMRNSMGATINLARPAGKAMAIMLILLMLLMPFSGSMTANIGNKDISALYENDRVLIMYGDKAYQNIKLDEIKSIKLLEELPEDLSRISGTSSEKIYKGMWSSKELGSKSLSVCLDPECSPYILIEKKNGNLILTGTRESENTGAFYSLLLQKLE